MGTLDDHSAVKAERLRWIGQSLANSSTRIPPSQANKEENRHNLRKISLHFAHECSGMSLASLMHDSASLDQLDQVPAPTR